MEVNRKEGKMFEPKINKDKDDLEGLDIKKLDKQAEIAIPIMNVVAMSAARHIVDAVDKAEGLDNLSKDAICAGSAALLAITLHMCGNTMRVNADKSGSKEVFLKTISAGYDLVLARMEDSGDPFAPLKGKKP
jgi:hypothetical protein